MRSTGPCGVPACRGRGLVDKPVPGEVIGSVPLGEWVRCARRSTWRKTTRGKTSGVDLSGTPRGRPEPRPAPPARRRTGATRLTRFSGSNIRLHRMTTTYTCLWRLSRRYKRSARKTPEKTARNVPVCVCICILVCASMLRRSDSIRRMRPTGSGRKCVPVGLPATKHRRVLFLRLFAWAAGWPGDRAVLSHTRDDRTPTRNMRAWLRTTGGARGKPSGPSR